MLPLNDLGGLYINKPRGNWMSYNLIADPYQKSERDIKVQSWSFWHLNEKLAISSDTVFYMHQKLKSILKTTHIFMLCHQQSLVQQVYGR